MDRGDVAVRVHVRPPLLLWLPALVFLGLFYLYPLGAVLRLGLDPTRVPELLAKESTTIARAVRFTVWQATVSTLLTLLVGLPGAYLFSHYRFPGKGLLQALTTLPFMMPTVVAAAGFNALLGPRGWVNLALMEGFNLSTPPIRFLNTFWAILVAHVFYNTAIVLRIVGTAWARLDPRLLEAARVLGAGRVRSLRQVTWPLLRPSILAAALLVFLFDFTSFGVVLILGGPRYATLEVEIYIQALRMLNLPLAAFLSVLQMAFVLILTVAYTQISARLVVPFTPYRASQAARPPRTRGERVFVAAMVTVLLVLLVSPLVALVLRSFVIFEPETVTTRIAQRGWTLAYYRALLFHPRQTVFYAPPALAIRNSLLYAGATVAISLALGLPTAWALARGRGWARVLDPILMLPLGTSSVTLGLGFLVAFRHPPLDLRTSPLLIPLAHSLVAFPFVVRTLTPALAAIPERLHEAAAVLGASPWRIWRTIDLPIISRSVGVAAVFAFTISMGEFGATALLVRPEYPTLPIAIYRFLSQPGGLNYGQAMALATLLMVIVGAGILLVERLRIPGVGEF